MNHPIKVTSLVLATGIWLAAACSSENKESTETTTTETEMPTDATSAPPETAAAPADTMMQVGQELFTTNCAMCHRLDKEVQIGPGLAGLFERRTEEWLIPWIKNSQKVIESGDQYAVALYEKYNKVAMPSYDYSDEEIKGILAYIKANQQK